MRAQWRAEPSTTERSMPKGNTTIPPLAGVHLLAGGIAPPPVAETADKRIWAMALTPVMTVLDRWVAQTHDLTGGHVPEIRLLISHPLLPTERTFVRCRGVNPVVDSEEFRGPAGALRDACAEMEESDTVLAGELSRCVMCPLDGLLETHASRGNDVTVAANPDGSPAGVYAITLGALMSVPSRGYTDIKEQWLPALRSEGRRVGVQRLSPPGVPSLRTARHFMDALRLLNEQGEVVVRDVSHHRNRASMHVSNPASRNSDRSGDPPTVRTGLFPDGSIKTPSGVVDGSATGRRALSDESTRPRGSRSKTGHDRHD